jgi:hypothetical protein
MDAKRLTVLLLLAFVLAGTLAVPHASAAASYGLFFLSSTAQSGCLTKCEQLLLTTGAADTATSVKDAKTVANFPVDPDVGASTTTATEGSSPSGMGWVFATDLGGVQIPSGTWTFLLTTTASVATGTAFIHIQVFSCLTASEGTCTKLITIDDAVTNIEATTTATQQSYSGTFGPFNVRFLAVEYWVDQTVAGSSTTKTVTITTVSSASSVQTPAWNEPLAGSVTQKSKFKYDAVVAGKAEETGTYVVGTATAFTIAAASTLTLVTARANIVGFLRGFSGLVTLTMSNLVTATQSANSQVITISNRATTANFAASATLAARRVSGFVKGLSATLTLSAIRTQALAVQRNLQGTISLVAARGSSTGFVRGLQASLTLSAARAQALAIKRNLPGSVTLAADITITTAGRVCHGSKCDYTRLFSGALTFVSSLSAVRGTSCAFTFCKTLTGAFTFNGAAAAPAGYVRNLAAAATFVSVLADRLTLLRALQASLSGSSLAQWERDLPGPGGTMITEICFSKPHSPTCTVNIDPFPSLSSKFTYGTSTISCSVVVLLKTCSTVLNQSWNLQASLSKAFAALRTLSGSPGASSSLSRSLVLSRGFPGSLGFQSGISAVVPCNLASSGPCSSNPNIAKAALAVAMFAVLLIVFVAWRVGAIPLFRRRDYRQGHTHRKGRGYY